MSHPNDEIVAMLKDCVEVLDAKGADYGVDNFIEAAKTAKLLTGLEIRPYQVAAVLIGIKFSRYKNLTASNKTPTNESLEDTLKDTINYLVLMERERRKENVKDNTIPTANSTE